MAQDPLSLLCIEPRFPGRLGPIADWLVRRRGYRCQFYCASADDRAFWPASTGRGMDVIQFNVGGIARQRAVHWTRDLERGLCYAYGCFEVLQARRPLGIDIVLGRSAHLGSTLFTPVWQPRVPIVNYFDYFYHPYAHDITADLGAFMPAEYFHWRRTCNAMDLLDLENGIHPWTATNWQRDLYPPEYHNAFFVLHPGVDPAHISTSITCSVAPCSASWSHQSQRTLELENRSTASGPCGMMKQHRLTREIMDSNRLLYGPSRREMLWRMGGGLGGIALAHLLGRQGLLADAPAAKRADLNGGLHHRARVKRVIQLFMNGGVSQPDTFDYKPELSKRHGQKFDPGVQVEAVTSTPGNVMKSPFAFKQHGQCGRWVSSVLPHLAGCVDELAFLMAMGSKTNVHGPASYLMNTGFVLPGFPCLGAWLSYGLGSLNDNLPTFVVLPDARGLPYNNRGNFSSGFLPVIHQGTIIKANAPNPIADLFPPKSAAFITRQSEKEGLDLLQQMNREHAEQWQGDSRLEARIASYELAAKMQVSAPEVLDVGKETAATHKLYGLDDKTTEAFGRNCLIARRMIERGVRFVQVWSGAGGPTNNWDNHSNITTELPKIAASVDRPIAGLLRDLKARGLLADTLVVWSTEFGRQPFSQGAVGRDHNGGTFVGWLAGAGIKAGTAYGESDEWSWRARKPTYCYDLHATILHLLGIDHTKLTFRHNGSDRRLTDVHGEVIKPILA